METVHSLEELNRIIAENTGVLAYFSHKRCNVCLTLKPKLSEVFKEQFPRIKQVYVDIEETPEVAAQQSIFAVPVIVVYFDGRESYRKARNVGIDELTALVKRPYQMIFES